MKIYYLKIIKEINDPISNETFYHKSLRLIIRLLLNLPFNCSFLLKIIRKINFKKTLCKILIDKNFYYYKYINYLQKGNLKELLKTKLKWANYIIKNENLHNNSSLNLALNYKKLIKKENKSSFPKKKSYKKSNIDFYIYGPNSKSYPKKEFSESTIILTKFPNFSTKNFNKKLLFLNNFTINKLDNKSLKKKCKNFSKVYIPKGNKKLLPTMEHIPNFPSDKLASPMNLARILSCLKTKHKKPLIVIEGFDLGIEKVAYSGKIESFYNKKNFNVTYRFDLMHHDHIYNFLLIKSLIQNFNFVKSEEFLEIINQNLEEYFARTYQSRDFKKIKLNFF